jgi:transposase
MAAVTPLSCSSRAPLGTGELGTTELPVSMTTPLPGAEKFPEEFKRDVVAVARRRTVPLAEVASDFGIGESTLQRWLHQADVDDGVKDGQTTAEQQEIVQLRRDKRRLEMEVEILRRAAAYFAQGTLPK